MHFELVYVSPGGKVNLSQCF